MHTIKHFMFGISFLLSYSWWFAQQSVKYQNCCKDFVQQLNTFASSRLVTKAYILQLDISSQQLPFCDMHCMVKSLWTAGCFVRRPNGEASISVHPKSVQWALDQVSCWNLLFPVKENMLQYAKTLCVSSFVEGVLVRCACTFSVSLFYYMY